MINLLNLSFKQQDENSLRVIYEKRNEFFLKVCTKNYSLNCNNIPLTLYKISSKKPENFFLVLKYFFFKLPIKLVFIFHRILLPYNSFYNSLQDCIIDGIERRSGDVREKTELGSFIRKHFFEFIFRSIYLIYLIEIIDFYKKIKGINTISCDQFSGYPFGGISAYCIKNNIFMFYSSIQERTYDNSLNINLIITKNIIDPRLALPHDLKDLSKISESSLNKYLNIIKKDYNLKKDAISNFKISKLFKEPLKYKKNEAELKHNSRDLNIIKKITKNDKKNGIVFIHLITDCPRKRCEDIWINNYLEWLNLTIDNCAKNKNINWFFKTHPWADVYPIKQKIDSEIRARIEKNNFFYITDSDFLHPEVARIASVVITCHGTCKMEYPALYEIPVISCLGLKELSYDSFSQPFTAKNKEEYEELIINAHNLSLSKIEIRKAKELLVFNKFISGKNVKEKLKIFNHVDKNGNKVIRNF